jgi:peptidoglycan L-alanyl-D-glutamate endopeptidase CwlK
MYVLGAKSKQRLAGVHPDLVACVKLAITLTSQDFTVLEGVRSIATQREYVNRGASQTMASRHLSGGDGYGHAVDLAAWVAGGVRWEWALYLPIADAMRRAAIQLCTPIRWGGTWQVLNDATSQKHLERLVAAYVARRRAEKRKAFLDGPHFELPKSPRYP